MSRNVGYDTKTTPSTDRIDVTYRRRRTARLFNEVLRGIARERNELDPEAAQDTREELDRRYDQMYEVYGTLPANLGWRRRTVYAKVSKFLDQRIMVQRILRNDFQHLVGPQAHFQQLVAAESAKPSRLSVVRDFFTGLKARIVDR